LKKSELIALIKLRLTATAEDNEAMLKLLTKLEQQGLIDILQTSNSYANRNSQYERIYVDMKVIDDDE
jgi:hypothetical protein